VGRHQGGAYDKSFKSWDHLVALVFAQLRRRAAVSRKGCSRVAATPMAEIDETMYAAGKHAAADHVTDSQQHSGLSMTVV
jgi:hypothetical protein